ncbi:helix-turn-helix domain-containing protein [Candidatus Woesearchaeota archaeon]|nr:helix-turn-helix domain-containing protein [Candidatus Woesearchaeota archaeon]
MKSNLIDEVSVFLLKRGYTVKAMKSGCFDILARKEQILMLKVVQDANSVTSDMAEDMKKLAGFLAAVPLIVAEKAGHELADNIVYTRYDVYTMNTVTLMNCVKRRLPIIKSTQAGYTAQLCGDELHEQRVEHGMSLNELAKKLGVSARMITKYEKGESEVTLKKALKLYDLFGNGVFEHIDIFSSMLAKPGSGKTEISKKYLELGFEAADTRRAPFDVIAKKDKDIILTEVGDKTSPHLLPWARLLEVDKLVIFKEKKPKNLPALSKDEFLEYEKSKELLKFLREFENK